MLNAEDGSFILNMLIVDDAANIRKTLLYCLAAGHTVIAVSNPGHLLVY